MIDFPKTNSHIYFVDDVKELAQEEPEEPRGDTEQKLNIPEVEDILEIAQMKKKAYKKLDEQINKARNYKRVFETLSMQKHLMVRIRCSK